MVKKQTYYERVIQAVTQSDQIILNCSEIIAIVNMADGSTIDHYTIKAISNACKNNILIKHVNPGPGPKNI